MRYIDLQVAFELEINKIDSNLAKPKSIDIEYWLNKGLEQFYKTRYIGDKTTNTGFEQTQKRIDDLRSLIRFKTFELDDETWNLHYEDGGKFMLMPDVFVNTEDIPLDKIQCSSNSVYYVRIPKDYVFLLGDRVGIIPINPNDVECVKKHNNGEVVPYFGDTIESSIETIDAQLNNSLSEHIFKHGKARPLKLMYDNLILLVTDGKYKVQNY